MYCGEFEIGVEVDFEVVNDCVLSVFLMLIVFGLCCVVVFEVILVNDCNKYVVVVFVFLIGMFGIYCFYLGWMGFGIVMFVLSIMVVGFVLMVLWLFIDMIWYLVMLDREFVVCYLCY